MKNQSLFFVRSNQWSIQGHYHCVKSVCIQSYSAVFSRSRTEYEDIQSISPYSVQMREETDQNNSKCGHFLRSECYVYDDSIEEVVSHSRLLLGRRVLTKFNSDFDENIIDCDTLFRRKNYLQTLVDHYQNRWKREYLFELR